MHSVGGELVVFFEGPLVIAIVSIVVMGCRRGGELLRELLNLRLEGGNLLVLALQEGLDALLFARQRRTAAAVSLWQRRRPTHAAFEGTGTFQALHNECVCMPREAEPLFVVRASQEEEEVIQV